MTGFELCSGVHLPTHRNVDSKILTWGFCVPHARMNDFRFSLVRLCVTHRASTPLIAIPIATNLICRLQIRDNVVKHESKRSRATLRPVTVLNCVCVVLHDYFFFLAARLAIAFNDFGFGGFLPLRI